MDAVTSEISLVDIRRWCALHIFAHMRFLEVPIIKKGDKMLNRKQKERSQSEITCIDDLVPKNHLLRKIDETVDFTKMMLYNKT